MTQLSPFYGTGFFDLLPSQPVRRLAQREAPQQ
jgi:hypothetical protein